MSTEPIHHREQAAFGKKRDMQRQRTAFEQRRLDLERQAGEAMLRSGAIPPEIRRALQEVRDDLAAAEYAIEAAETAVKVAQMEDQAETIERDRADLCRFLAERESAAADTMAVLQALAPAAERLQAVERRIVALLGPAGAVQGPDGYLVHPGSDTLLRPDSFSHRASMSLLSIVPGWEYRNVPLLFSQYDLAVDVRREAPNLLAFFDAAAPGLVSNRGRPAAEDPAEEVEQMSAGQPQPEGVK